MQKVLLTGGNGFIGRNLLEHLRGKFEIEAPTSRELDLCRYDQVEEFIKGKDFEIVLHTATWNATANSIKDREQVLEKNLAMFFNLARMEEHFGKMIYFGSGAEYGRDHYRPRMGEGYFDAHVPQDQYGLSKYIMAKHTGMARNIIDLRVFGCFGPHEDWEIRFISNAICKAIHHLPITLRQNVRFDYMWVGDLARITEWFMRNDARHKHYNACTGTSTDLISLARTVNKVTGAEVPILVRQEGMRLEYSGDNTRLMSELEDFEFTDMESAIRALHGHYLDNLDKIDRPSLLADKE